MSVERYNRLGGPRDGRSCGRRGIVRSSPHRTLDKRFIRNNKGK